MCKHYTSTIKEAPFWFPPITITKQELQEARDHYCKVADKFKPRKNKEPDYRYTLYLGKAAVLTDMLKMFEPIDFV